VCMCVYGVLCVRQQRKLSPTQPKSHTTSTQTEICGHKCTKRYARACTHTHTHTHTNCHAMTFTHRSELLHSIIKFNCNRCGLSANTEILLHSCCHTRNSVCPNTCDWLMEKEKVHSSSIRLAQSVSTKRSWHFSYSCTK